MAHQGRLYRGNYEGGYDLIIAHPPCTYLSNAATRSFSTRVTPAEKVIARWEERAKAAVFFMRILESDCPRIAVENPVGFMNTAYRKPDQIIHPWMWAESEADEENYKTKRTCLWLKGLPLLVPNGKCKPYNNAEHLGRRNGSGKVRNWCEDLLGKDRQKERSKTFPGIAAAFAEQWGGDIRDGDIDGITKWK